MFVIVDSWRLARNTQTNVLAGRTFESLTMMSIVEIVIIRLCTVDNGTGEVQRSSPGRTDPVAGATGPSHVLARLLTTRIPATRPAHQT